VYGILVGHFHLADLHDRVENRPMKTNKQDNTPRNKKAPNQLIGTLSESSLHSALKEWYAGTGDLLETQVDGFHIDIIRDNLLIEIQTGNFSSQKRKLHTPVERYALRLVYPIAREKWIVRLGADGVTLLGRRKSPKRGTIFQLFEELVSIPDLIKHPNFSLEVLLIQEEEIRCEDGTGSWRRKGLSICDRRLIEVLSRHVFKQSSDFSELVPSDLPEPFSTEELGLGIGQPQWLAQKMVYCLRNMGALEIVGKNGNSLMYSSSNTVNG
jgi:hypothetical protein